MLENQIPEVHSLLHNILLKRKIYFSIIFFFFFLNLFSHQKINTQSVRFFILHCFSQYFAKILSLLIFSTYNIGFHQRNVLVSIENFEYMFVHFVARSISLLIRRTYLQRAWQMKRPVVKGMESSQIGSVGTIYIVF